MEEKEILEVIEEHKKRFGKEEDIKKPIDETVEKHKAVEEELTRFFVLLKAEKKVMKLYKFMAMGHPANEITELYNVTEVLETKVDERLFLLEKIGILLSAMQRTADTRNDERTITMLSLMYPLLCCVGEEASLDLQLYRKQVKTLETKEPYVLEEEDLNRKKSLENDINEIRRILNND